MFGAIAGGIASALAGGAMSKLFGGGQKAASGGIQGDVLATRSEERFSRNAETDLVCRLLLEKKNPSGQRTGAQIRTTFAICLVGTNGSHAAAHRNERSQDHPA